jgi:2'-phosphotransferase
MSKIGNKLEYDDDRNPANDLNPSCTTKLYDHELKTTSKAISWILRHGAEKDNIPITKNGFVSLNKIITCAKSTQEDIAYIVLTDNKERYKMVYKKNTNDIYIRANQGHSIKNILIEMKQITNSQQIPTAVHGTYYEFWKLIKDTGLKIMNRQHVHFAKGLPGDTCVISGMRTNVQVLIYIDIDKMLQDNIKIFESENGVILSSGIDGIIIPKYFKTVLDAKTKKQIYSVTDEIQKPKTVVGAVLASKQKKKHK